MRIAAAGAVVMVVLAGCFGPADDDDLLDADTEREGWAVEIQLADGSTQSRHVTSDPGKMDTDRDGVPDYIEFVEKTDPRNVDTDGDGLLDGEDVVLRASNSRVAAWRALDIIEQAQDEGQVRFLGERGDPTFARGGDPHKQDSDGDGVADGDEERGYEIVVEGETRRVTTAPVFSDSDGDGLDDGLERFARLDASRKDTDGDGISDRGDVDPYRDVKVRFVVGLVDLASSQERTVWFDVFGLDIFRYISDALTVGNVSDEEADAFSSGTLDPRDDGGNFLSGEHNVSFLVQTFAEGSAGDSVVVDLYSETTGFASIQGRVNARTGALTYRVADVDRPWPVAFRGPDGSASFRVALMD